MIWLHNKNQVKTHSQLTVNQPAATVYSPLPKTKHDIDHNMIHLHFNPDKPHPTFSLIHPPRTLALLL